MGSNSEREHERGLPPGVGLAQGPPVRGVSRRTFLRGGFWGVLGLMSLSSLGVLWNVIWPRKIQGFGSTIVVPADKVPKPGDDPVHIIEGKFYLVNLKPGEGAWGQFGVPAKEGGLLAIYHKCTHLGCTIPWRPEFVFQGEKSWFRCPCHGTTCTKAGIRVFGPAPRPLDTMALEVDPQGNVLVHTGQIKLGGQDNPLRTVAYRVQQAAKRLRPSSGRG